MQSRQHPLEHKSYRQSENHLQQCIFFVNVRKCAINCAFLQHPREKPLENWEILKTAYVLTQYGTVSETAKRLGVHRATVIRHVDALEEELGKKIFVRHKGGYTATVAGKDLMRVAKVADEQFHLLSRRIKEKTNTLEGDLTIACADAFAHLLLPALQYLQATHTALRIKFVAPTEKLRMEYGEAHIAIHFGDQPNSHDNIVESFGLYEFGMFASRNYIERFGLLTQVREIPNHQYILRRGIPRTEFERWMLHTIPFSSVALEASSPTVIQQAINAGIGIGFIPLLKAQETYPHLVEVFSRREKWHLPLWVVTHKDMYHTEKVQAFLKSLQRHKLLD